MNDEQFIEIPERKIETYQNRFVNKHKRRRKKDFLSNAKPKEGNSLYRYKNALKSKLEKYGLQRYNTSSDIIPYDTDRDKFIDDYIRALSARYDLLPHVYCCKSYLRAHTELVPAINKNNGFRSFICESNSCFYLPSYKWMDTNKVFWKMRDSKVTFPLAVTPTAGLRLDVQYMFLRDVSVYMIPKALKIRNTMKNIPYKAYTLPYTDHSKDTLITDFITNYKNIVRYRIMTEDVSGFEKMLFNDYGQHRYVLERTDTNRIVAVLLWEDTGEVINMLYTVGYIEPMQWYGYTDWRAYRTEKCLRYPETILRYEFMKCFPKGTMFNGGGCGFSSAIRWMNQISQPCHVYEIRTYRNITRKKINGQYVEPCGLLPFEYYMSTHSPTWWVDCTNKVLFNKSFKKKLSEMTDEDQIKRELKYRKRQAARFLGLKRLGEKYLKNMQNNT